MAKKKHAFKGSERAKQEWEQMSESMRKIRINVRRARYLHAFKLAKKAIKQFPDNRFAQYRIAVSTGDCGEWASPGLQRANAKRAARMLKELLRRSSGIDRDVVQGWKNEYYWF